MALSSRSAKSKLPPTSEKPAKVMLIGSKPLHDVERSLRRALAEVVTVRDGEAAIVQAQHANFVMAVVVSTGKTMDLAETVFNLRDVCPSMPILIVDERHRTEADVLAPAGSNTRTVTIAGLTRYMSAAGLLRRELPPRRKRV